MDNIIAGFINVAIFLSFIIGLAFSIKSIPFAIIVALVSVMILVDYYQSAKEGIKLDKDKKLGEHI